MIKIYKSHHYYCFIEGISLEQFDGLKRILFYTDTSQVIRRSMALKQRGFIPDHLQWNGIVRLIDENPKNKKQYRYPAGLHDMVIGFLDKNYLQYKVHEEKISYTKEILPNANNIQLRPHQIQALKAVEKEKFGILHASVAFGKTKTSIKITEELGAFPMIFIVHRMSLVDQTYKEYVNFFGEENVGYIGNGIMDIKKANMCSIATIYSALKAKHVSKDKENLRYTEEQLNDLRDLIKNARLLIYDEVHHANANNAQTILKKMENALYKVGLSATPYSSNGSEILLQASFGPIIYQKTSSSLIEEGFLIRPKIYFCEYKDPINTKKYPMRNSSKTYRKIYNECIVENDLYNRHIVKLALANADMDRSTLISIKHVEHGKSILKLFNEFQHEHTVHLVTGRDKKQKVDRLIQEFADKKYNIIISTLLDEGSDIPGLDAVINAGGGKSRVKTMQLVGRALRMAPGKTVAYIYDFIHPYTFLYVNSHARIETLSEEPSFQIKKMMLD